LKSTVYKALLPFYHLQEKNSFSSSQRQGCFFFESKFAGSLQEKSVPGFFLKRFNGYCSEIKNFCMFCKKREVQIINKTYSSIIHLEPFIFWNVNLSAFFFRFKEEIFSVFFEFHISEKKNLPKNFFGKNFHHKNKIHSGPGF